MSKKHNHIKALTPELIKAYQEGSLTADEMYAVEKFLLENPFEAEALEGLEMVAPDALDTHMADLNARLANQLSEDEETKVVFWNMTRKIAASLLVLATAAFLFFWQEPDVTTKEITQADNKTEQPANATAHDSVEVIIGAARGANRDDKARKKEEDNTIESTDSENLNSGWTDKNQLQTKSESSPSPKLEATQEELIRNDLNEPINVSLASLAGDKTQKPILNENVVIKTEDRSAAPPVYTGVAVLMTDDSLNTRLRAEANERALLGRAAGVEVESQRVLRMDFRSKNDVEQDSNKALKFAYLPDLAREKSKSQVFLFTISGTVTDDEGNPLAGVQVQIKGTSIGMLTDTNGAYSLGSVTVIGSLLFRYLGYATQEREVKDQKEINVEMIPDVSSLGEVVVSDYAPPQPPDEEEVIKNYNPARPVYGQKAFNQHVKENLIYPEAAAVRNIKGRVLVEFTVTAEGDLKDIKVLKGLGYGCDEEAIRLVKTGPRWQARRTGVDRSTPVDSKVKVRIRFKP